MKPKEIQIFTSGELGIIWDEGHESIFNTKILREHCPCARCRESHQKPVSVDLGQYTIKEIAHVGHYAIEIHWADGHKTGIYAFDFLMQICPCEACHK